MSKLYTEEQVRKAIALGYDWCHQKHIPDDFMIDNFINSLTPIELPTDEEIENKALNFTEQESYGELNGNLWKGFVFGAKCMRDKIKGS